MVCRCLLALLAFAVLLPTAAPAQTRLQWNLNPGDTFYLETTHETKQTVTYQGRPVQQDVEYTTVASFQVVRAEADGYVLKQKIESVKPKGEGPGVAETGKLLQQMEGAVYTISFDPRMQVVKVDGHEAVITKIAGDNIKLRKLLASRLNPDTLATDVGNLFGLYLPERDVIEGTSWKREARYPLGTWGAFVGTAEYTARGKRRLPNGTMVEQIDALWSLHYEVPKKDVDAVLTVSRGDLKLDTARGVYLFDPAAGRLLSFERTVAFKGALTILNAGNEVTMDLIQTTSSRNRFLDKLPPAK